MSRSWLTDSDEVYRLLTDNKQPVFRLSDLGQAPLSDGEVIVVAAGDRAKEQAISLRERGIAAERLSYVDIQPEDDLLDRMRNPKHFFWDDVCWLSELENTQEGMTLLEPGLPMLGSWRWRVPELCVLAGPYGCGKSTLGQILAAHFVRLHGDTHGRAMLCSWEDLSAEVFNNMQRFGESHGIRDMTSKVAFVRRNASEDRLVSWYMDLVRYHRKRYGTRFFFLDPWNEMDHIKDVRQSETDYVRDIMKETRRLVDEEQIIQIVATHVSAKYVRGNGEIEPFKIAHSFGSSQFANKSDRGICLVRTKTYDQDTRSEPGTGGHAVIRLDKSKIEQAMGKKMTVAARFDYRAFDYRYDPHVTSELKDVWKD